MTGHVLALIGAPGTGKSWLGKQLAPALGLPRLAIDDFGKPGTNRWDALLAAVDQRDGKVLVESCTVPRKYRPLIGLSVHRRARSNMRFRHLRKRGESRAEARRMVRDIQRVPRRGDINLHGEMTASAVADLADRLAGLGWVGSNPDSGDLDTARPAEKKVYGLPNAGARG